MASNSIVEEPECRDSVIHIPSDLPPADWPECCIYRVPKKLRKVNEEAYTPKLVSIGPFHHDREELRDMEMHKLRYFKDFFHEREGVTKTPKDLLQIIKYNEDEIHRCYSETFDRSEAFVNMILLDAIFIIELFLKYSNSEEAGEEEKDYILRKPWLAIGIHYDLMLLENQLPFFILEKLYMLAFNDSSTCNHGGKGKQIEEHKKDLEKDDAPFIKLSRKYFKGYDMQPLSILGKEVKHFTDLIRYFFCPKYLKPTGHLDQLYCATKLDDAGLTFKQADEERSLLDIRFSGKKQCLKYFPCLNLSWLLSCLPCLKSVFPCLKRMQCILEVPSLEIVDSTEALYRNLIALEQCHYPIFNAYICNYVMLLDYLIDTEKDVKLLVDKKVIFNKIGSNGAVTALINNLCIGIVEDKSCYADLGKEINDYCDNYWNRMMASMKNLYFRDFWRGTATVVGLIVLGFTFWDFLEPYFAMRVDLKQVI